jgi:hypothetical protein
VAFVVAAWIKRTPDHSQDDHNSTAMDKLRADMMSEFKDLGRQIGDVRDRVSRIEGAIGKDGR